MRFSQLELSGKRMPPTTGVIAVLLVLVAFVSGGNGLLLAQESGGQTANPSASAPPPGVLESGPNGAVDWSQGMITAYGEGAVAPDAPNPGSARLGAIRAAKADALRNILEMIRQVHVSSTTTVENSMVSSDVIKTKVEGVIRGAVQIGEPTYLSDATVRVTMGVPLTDALSDAVLPEGGFSTAAPKSFPPVERASGVFTGLIVDARGLGAKPAMAPKLFDVAGGEIYGTSQVNRQYAVEQGMVGYAKSLDTARKDSRVSDNPLVVKATKVMGSLKADLVTSDADARRIREAAAKMSFLEQCRVMIVVD